MSEFNIEESKLLKYIVDSINHPVVFVDTNHVIRYLNKSAENEYYGRRKLKTLIGRPLFSCHPPYAIPTIENAFEKLKNGENEIYLYFDKKKENDLYLVAVRDENETLIGYYERFEEKKSINM